MLIPSLWKKSNCPPQTANRPRAAKQSLRNLHNSSSNIWSELVEVTSRIKHNTETNVMFNSVNEQCSLLGFPQLMKMLFPKDGRTSEVGWLTVWLATVLVNSHYRCSRVTLRNCFMFHTVELLVKNHVT